MRVFDGVEIDLPDGGTQEVVCRRNVDVPASFFHCLPNSDTPALCAAEKAGPPALSYRQLRGLISGAGNLAARGIGKDDVVAIVARNGPELAALLLICMCQCAAAPLDPSMSQSDLLAAVQQLSARHVLAFLDHTSDGKIERVCLEAPCRLHLAVQTVQHAGAFSWLSPGGQSTSAPPPAACWPEADSVALLLRTSGTTAKPKVVPLTMRGLYTGALCIGRGLALTVDDVGLNVMPLTHIGGISCSLLAALVTGGSVICAPGFDPASFVSCLELMRPTWYYAAPTIHKAVAIFAKTLPKPVAHSLRLIRSGAANLPDVDARELQGIFGCAVLPTYSMSECMPIAQPPLGYDLSRPGSVGVPIASSLRIADSNGAAVPYGQDGEVCIRGPVVMRGYAANEEANAACFFADPDDEGCRWFRTGDVGHLDRQGFLFLTGRSKELIKRGGDQVSPYEVEEVFLAHPAVEVAVVFGVPNDFWGEEVAAAVLLKPRQAATAAELTAFAQASLPSSKVPKQLVFLRSAEELPRTRTGKYMRVGLAARLGLAAVDVEAFNVLRGSAPSRQKVKPHKAIYGLRYVFAMWVVFVHFGPDSPVWLFTWKNYSFSMPGFFMLAGFLLASSASRPVASKLQFYKNRLVAAHPLYLLAVLYSLPLTFLLCPPDGPGVAPDLDVCSLMNRGQMPKESVLPGSYGAQLAYGLVMTVFAQLAWPWGIPAVIGVGMANGVLWFSSAYYFCVLCFPFFHGWMNSRCCLGRDPSRHMTKPFLRFCLWPLGAIWVFSTVGGVVAWELAPKLISLIGNAFENPVIKALLQAKGSMQGVGGFFSYACPPTWALIFFVGMLLQKLFSLSRSTPGVQLWRHWGALTDFTTLLMMVSPLFGSLLFAIDPRVKHIVYPGGSIDVATGATVDVGTYWGGDGYGSKLVTGLLAVWIYGLATGEGRAAKFLGNPVLVNYLSPAAYSVYLFQYPTAMYWTLFKRKVLHSTDSLSTVGGWAGILDYLVVLLLTTCIALLAAHKLNAPLTALFKRFVDLLCHCLCCGRCREAEAEGTLEAVAEAVRGLSGADVDASTAIAECGLDSFGTSALLGVLRPRFRGLTLTPLEVYRLRTVGDLVARIDQDLASAAACGAPRGLGGQRDEMREPLAENASV